MIPCGLSCNCQLCDLIAPDVDEHVLMWWGEWWGPERELTCACTNFVAYCLLTIVIVERGTHNMKVSCGWTNDDSIFEWPECALLCACYLRHGVKQAVLFASAIPAELQPVEKFVLLHITVYETNRRHSKLSSKRRCRVANDIEIDIVEQTDVLWNKRDSCEERLLADECV